MSLTDEPFPQRFTEKYDVQPNGCWLWNATTYEGYGYFQLEGKPRRAHRLSYLWTKGEIPADLQLDHLCRNKACVNPDHLEAVTSQTNVRRERSLKTHCPYGHPYSGDNLYIGTGNRRVCRTCQREYQREWNRIRKVAV